jgi:hypothetical protein
MAMARSLQNLTTLSALIVALATSGCADAPVIGPYVSSAMETVKPLLHGLSPVLAPIKGMFGMGQEEAAPVVSPTPRVRTNRPAKDAEEQTAAASTSAAPAPAEPTRAQFSRVVERNKEFDRLRTTGLMQLYGGETRMAIDTFEQAAKLRPDDAHIRELLELAKAPPSPSRSRSFGGEAPVEESFDGAAPPPFPGEGGI